MSFLIGRDPELAIAERFVSEEGKRSRLLLIDGAPGIGKTAFLAEVVEIARRRGQLILEANPAAMEADLSFAALTDLLQGGKVGAVNSLPEPQRVALEIALLLRSPEDTPPQRRAVATGLLSLLRALAADRPVLLSVDDAQWLDQPTAAALRFVARRLGEEKVALALARRSGTAHHLGDWLSGEQQTLVELRPLTLGAVHALLLDRLGVTPKRPELRRIHDWSRGNPLHALELGRAHAEGSVRFDAASSVPISLENLLTSRIQKLPTETRLGLAVVAAASAPTTAQIAAILEINDAVSVLDPAVSEGVVEIVGSRVAFTHPLLASAAYGSVDGDTLRHVHARLAESTDDPDERARHLAHATEGVDGEVAFALEKAAESVYRRGAPLLAADLAKLAGDRTPPDDPTALKRRALAEAGYRFEAGDTHAASTLVSRLIEEQEQQGPERAELLSLLARYYHFADDLDKSGAYFRAARNEAGDDPRLRFGIEEGLAWNLLLMRSDLATADQAAANAVQLAKALGDDAARAEALAVASLTRSALGRESDELIHGALALEQHTLSLRVLRHPSFAHASLLTARDRFDEAHGIFLELVDRAESSGDESALPTLLHHSALVRCLRGDFANALASGEEAVVVAAQEEQTPAQVSARGRVALVRARLGDGERAETVARQALALACPDGYDPAQPRPAMARGGEVALWALGTSALLAGHAEEAALYLYPMAEVFREAGYRNPGEMRFLTDTVEALVQSGRLVEASTTVRWMETMPIDRPGAAGAMAMGRGLLASGEGDLAKAEEQLSQAVEALRLAPLPFELGRALLALGKVRRRSRGKAEARRALEEATATFERLGSYRWAQVAREEARRVGGTKSTIDGFTETELRVSELIAAGFSNKEIAGQLFVSRKTVEATLTRLYAKIGIRSRTELVRWAMERSATP